MYDLKLSKYLSYILRHQPQSGNIVLDSEGWASIENVIHGYKAGKMAISKKAILLVVEHNPKKRFEVNETQTHIRAVQGHSKELGINIEMKEFIPESEVFHGTIETRVSSILENGLNSGNRNHVHLSKDKETAINVGQRHGKPVLLKIDARKMRADGYKLLESKNGVILIDFVPPQYISRA